MIAGHPLNARYYNESYLLQYKDECYKGNIVVGEELKIEFERILADFQDSEMKIEFDDAHKRINFIETKCKQFEAPFAGSLFYWNCFRKL